MVRTSGALGASLLLVAHALAQTPAMRAADLVVRVEAALAIGDEETAAELLASADPAVKEVPASARGKLLERLQPARARLAPRLSVLRQAERAAAQRLLDLARTYASRGWKHTASEYADAAEDISVELAGETARQMRLAAGDRLIAVGNVLPLWFAADVSLPYGGDPWPVRGSRLWSPVLKSHDTVAVVCHRAVPASFEAHLALTFPPTAAKFAFLFGYRPDDTYYLFQVRRGKHCALDCFYYDGKLLQRVQQKDMPSRALADASFELTVTVDKDGLRGRIGAHECRLPAGKMPRPAAGLLGFFISGDTASPDPIAVETLRLEKLEAK